MNTVSGRGIVYNSQNHPAWKTAIEQYEQAVQSAKESVKEMKVPGSQTGYNEKSGQFGQGIAYLNEFMFAKTDAEKRKVELNIIHSKVPFLLRDVAAKLHQADPQINQKTLFRHLVDKASNPEDFYPRRIGKLFSKIRNGDVRSNEEKAECQARKVQAANPVAAAVASCVLDYVDVFSNSKGKGVRAKRQISEQELIIQGWGKPSPARTMHTIQVDTNAHLEPIEPFLWLNHNCQPNCGLLIAPGSLKLYALRPIKRGEEFTVDYETFEEQVDFMKEKCRCHSQKCRGNIRGYKYLTEDVCTEMRETYGKYMAPYLLRP